jgi:fatty acid desaturase
MPVNTTSPDVNGGYMELCARIREEGLFNRRLGYYAVKGFATVAALAGAWAGLFALGDTWTALPLAATLGVIFTQIVFFGHDAGHHQIFKAPKANLTVGLLAGNLLTGLSFGWWVPKHSAHHAHPNQVGRDPDIGPGVVAFTAEAAAGRRRTFGRLAARFQAWTFIPLLMLEGAALHVASIQHLRRQSRPIGVEAALITLHTLAYLGAVFWVLSPLRAVVFIAVHQGVFGLAMGASFAPNHKGMPIIDTAARPSFPERQVLTARNVTGGRLVTFLLGALNYQIEHHLFPRMPRANLARSQPLVQAFCADHGLPYHQDTIVGSYRAALGHLSTIGTRGVDPRLPETPGGASSTPTPVLQDAV